MTRNPTCANCIHSTPVLSDHPHEGPILKCHRYPPVLIILDGDVSQAHPDAYEVCGEHPVMVALARKAQAR